MELSAVGSITAYVRSIKTAESVRSGIETGFSSSRSAKDTADFSSEARAAARSSRATSEEIAEKMNDIMEKLDSLFAQKEYDKANDTRLSSIKAKMRTGYGLTPSEQQYLAAKDPDAYSSFQRTETAKKMYRCSLNACRTKDEVNAMRLSNALSALSAYKKSIRNGGDGADVAGLNAALDREIRSFTGTSNYRRLPTVAECNKFDRDLAKAKKKRARKKACRKAQAGG